MPPEGSISTFKNLGASTQLMVLKLPVVAFIVASPITIENIPCALVTTFLTSIYSGVASTLLLMMDNLKLILELAKIVPLADLATP